MPSTRFIVVEIFSLAICLFGWLARGRILTPALPILALVWCSFTIDLLCYACWINGLEYEPYMHIYTMLEFLLEAQFISGVTDKNRIKQVLNIVLPLYFFVWIGSQFWKVEIVAKGLHFMVPGLFVGDEALTIFSDVIMNACIIWTLLGQIQSTSDLFPNASVPRLITKTIRDIWQSQTGKMFAGLFAYNTLGLVIFAVQLSAPNMNLQYEHSAAHILKNTCFLLAFLQPFRRK